MQIDLHGPIKASAGLRVTALSASPESDLPQAQENVLSRYRATPGHAANPAPRPQPALPAGHY